MHVTAHACNMHEPVFYSTCMLCACYMQVIYGTIPYLLYIVQACTVHVTCMFAVWYVNAWSIHVYTCCMYQTVRSLHKYASKYTSMVHGCIAL